MLIRHVQRRGDAASTPQDNYADLKGTRGDSGDTWKLGWFYIGHWRSADKELAFIEQKRAQEAENELRRWDQKLLLRTRSLSELRNMAA